MAAEVGRNPAPFHWVGRVSTMRERWRYQSAFVADVLRFGLSASHYYSGVRDDEVADAIDQIVGGEDAVPGIHRLGSLMMTRLLTSPMFRLGLIAAAGGRGRSGDPVIREAISEGHREARPLWRKSCEDFLRSRHLRIRPGITIDDCIALLSALADGLAMQALADPSNRGLDRDGQRSLLGMGALALIAGCLQTAGRGESKSLEQAVNDLLGSPAAGAQRTMA